MGRPWADTRASIRRPLISSRRNTASGLGDMIERRSSQSEQASRSMRKMRSLRAPSIERVRMPISPNPQTRRSSYFARARDVARTTAEMQDALWGEFVTTVELEREGAAEILRQFEACSSGTIDELVRTHNGRLYLATRRGFLPQAIEAARPIAELAPEARDPVVRVSFVHIYSGALRLTTNYAAARDQVALGLREAEVYHLDFARPHMLLNEGCGSCRCRRIREGLWCP